jgi:hypothetical protein
VHVAGRILYEEERGEEEEEEEGASSSITYGQLRI